MTNATKNNRGPTSRIMPFRKCWMPSKDGGSLGIVSSVDDQGRRSKPAHSSTVLTLIRSCGFILVIQGCFWPLTATLVVVRGGCNPTP